jgi:hypothetical protein
MTETQKKFIEKVDDLEHIIGVAMAMSLDTTERDVDSWREQYCSYIFTKLILHVQALLSIRPTIELPNDRFEIGFWDISSMAALARALIDSYYVFFYLGVDEAEKDELEFRFHLWDYHGEKQRLDMLRKIKSTDPILEQLEGDVQNLKDQLIDTNFYKSLDNKVQSKIRKGEIGIFYTNSQLSKKAGISSNYYKSTYNSLSAHVHAYPYALTQLAVFRANDDDSLAVINTIMDDCIGYVCYAVRDFVKLMPDQRKNIDQRAKSLIEHWEDVFSHI